MEQFLTTESFTSVPCHQTEQPPPHPAHPHRQLRSDLLCRRVRRQAIPSSPYQAPQAPGREELRRECGRLSGLSRRFGEETQVFEPGREPGFCVAHEQRGDIRECGANG